jgi:hypothetical protein
MIADKTLHDIIDSIMHIKFSKENMKSTKKTKN